jgi:hypothetical protein
MGNPAGPLGLILVALFVVVALARRRRRHRHHDGDAWASVRLTYTDQADGCFPIGVVRVQNPALLPVIVSASVRVPLSDGRRRHGRRSRRSLSVRTPKVGRRPRPPEGVLLGAVEGGGVRVWELPLGRWGRLPVVKVRLDQAGPRTRVFAWAVYGSPVCPTRPADETRPALAD